MPPCPGLAERPQYQVCNQQDFVLVAGTSPAVAALSPSCSSPLSCGFLCPLTLTPGSAVMLQPSLHCPGISCQCLGSFCQCTP